ncbi:hypothetical protein ABZ297_46565, partial [Nonomuraea sp. NPDC005983]
HRSAGQAASADGGGAGRGADAAAGLRPALGAGPGSTVVLLCTEGADANPATLTDSGHLESTS